MNQFERDVFDRLNAFEKEVIDRLGRIETKLDTDYRTLHGNGKPGLVEKVALIEDRLRDIETKNAEKNKHYGAITAAIAFIVNAAIALYALWKKP